MCIELNEILYIRYIYKYYLHSCNIEIIYFIFRATVVYEMLTFWFNLTVDLVD